MDDLYQNAWSESAESSHAPFSTDPPPSWSTPTKLASTYGEEADLAAPSWSTGSGIRWDEPSSPGFSWAQTDQDAGWGSSTYEGINLGKHSLDSEETPNAHDIPEVDDQQTTDDLEPAPTSTGTVTRTPSPKFEPLPSSPPPSAAPLSPPARPVLTHEYEVEVNPVGNAPGSPDAFGSFESGLPEDIEHSPGFAVGDTETDPWGSAWADSKSQEVEEEPVDEWERARQEKAKQDKKVVRCTSWNRGTSLAHILQPPELLASILSQSEEVSAEICPAPKESEPLPEKDAWLNDRRSGMESVPGL